MGIGISTEVDAAFTPIGTCRAADMPVQKQHSRISEVFAKVMRRSPTSIAEEMKPAP
jgi:hypothetical protein